MQIQKQYNLRSKKALVEILKENPTRELQMNTAFSIQLKKYNSVRGVVEKGKSKEES